MGREGEREGERRGETAVILVPIEWWLEECHQCCWAGPNKSCTCALLCPPQRGGHDVSCKITLLHTITGD